MKIPFSPPYIDDTVINEVVDSLRSGWITSGPKVKALEEEINIGVNVGRLGFAADLEPDDIGRLKKLVNKEYTTEKRILLDVEVNKDVFSSVISVFFLLLYPY